MYVTVCILKIQIEKCQLYFELAFFGLITNLIIFILSKKLCCDYGADFICFLKNLRIQYKKYSN